jgi:addiction module HigA family antidote
MAIKLHSSFAVHPGAWLRAEVIDPHGLSVTDAAARLRVTRQAMSNLLGSRAGLSAEMAIRFEKAFGLSADTLMRMQAAHDLAAARARGGEIEVERVAPLVA